MSTDLCVWIKLNEQWPGISFCFFSILQIYSQNLQKPDASHPFMRSLTVFDWQGRGDVSPDGRKFLGKLLRPHSLCVFNSTTYTSVRVTRWGYKASYLTLSCSVSVELKRQVSPVIKTRRADLRVAVIKARRRLAQRWTDLAQGDVRNKKDGRV